jgi:cobalt-zinc-cadmium efflux system protein
MTENHDHANARGGHDHTHGANERSVGIAAAITGAFMALELFGGIVSGSLALIADAGHMLTDFAGLTLAWFAFYLARRPASWKRTYGFDRFAVLVAFMNGITLFVIAGWIAYEAYERLSDPVEVLGGLMLWIALAGLVANIVTFFVLRRGDTENLNIRAAVLHVAGDLLGSVAAICVSLVIIATGWTPIDPILSVVVALIILRAAWKIIAESGHILLEGSPTGIDVRDIRAALETGIPDVEEIHHVHAWSISQERPMITLHARVREGTNTPAIVSAIKKTIATKYGIDHTTVEIEHDGCADDDERRPPTAPSESA